MRAHQPVVEMQRTPSRLREQATVSLTPSPETRAYEQAVSARERAERIWQRVELVEQQAKRFAMAREQDGISR